jgi:hypothetical protein
MGLATYPHDVIRQSDEMMHIVKTAPATTSGSHNEGWRNRGAGRTRIQVVPNDALLYVASAAEVHTDRGHERPARAGLHRQELLEYLHACIV